mmetsp:Transcript_29678/g.38363  ORF Transcript_29678/g.38363 Transcript_29678/m.38363 type:complete len:264 (-) Transcript_29678:304-1095(-)
MEDASMSLLCVVEGIRSKKPLSVKNWGAMTEKAEGRDKFLKIVQYGSRFWAWYFLSLNDSNEFGQKMYKLYRVTQLSRKAYRLLKVVNEIEKLSQTLKRKNTPAWLMAFLVLKHLGIGTFWVYDNLIYLNEANMSPVTKENALKMEARGWFVSSVAGIVTFITAISMNHKKRFQLADQLNQEKDEEQKTQIEMEIKKLSKAQFRNFVMLIKSCCDTVCSGNMPGVDIPKRALGSKLNDGVVGLLGVVSGAATCFCAWPESDQS